MNGCTVVDNVGIPSSTRRKYGVKEYRIIAKDSDIRLDNDNLVTKGLSLIGGKLIGVGAIEFQGQQTKTVFK